jgi:hypothetical protein
VLIQNVSRGEFEERIFGNQYDMMVYSKDGKYYVKDSAGKIIYSSTSASDAIQYAIDNAVSLTGYTVDSSRFVVVKGVSIPPGLRLKANVVHIDEDYAVYTPNGIILSPYVYRRMVLYIRDRPVNLINGEVFENRNILFTNGWIYINRGGYLMSTSKLYTSEVPWRSDAVDIGGWCWVNHPNITYADGYIFLTYVGITENVNKRFAATIAKINPSIGSVSTYILWDDVDDDHATPALDILPDGRLITTVSKHNGTVIRVAISNNPYDISDWTIRDIDLKDKLVNNNVSYPVPVVLSSTIYIFFRDGYADNSIWRYIYSTDGGNTWSDPVTFLVPPSGVPSIYVFLTRIGNKVYFTANLAYGGEDIPKKNVYFFYFDGSAFYKADGTKIVNVGTSFTPDNSDKVFDSDVWNFYGAWSYDVYTDGSGNPIIAFATFKNVGTRLYQHFYYIARWDGSRWIINKIADDGDLHPIIVNEYLYSGGIWIMRSDPIKVLVSRKRGMGWGIEIRDLNGNLISVVDEPEKLYEMNIHPIESNGYIFWMSGTYVQKDSFSTYILSNAKILTSPRTVTTLNRDFVLSLWFTMEPDMDAGIRHIINELGYYAVRFNNKKLETVVWGTNLISPTTLPVGEHHVLMEFSDGRLYAYLDGSLYSYDYRRLPSSPPPNAGHALEIGYRLGYSTPEWWGRVRDIVLIYGRVGRATKLALYNARFYNGIVVPEPNIYRGVAVLRANSTRVTVQHFINKLPSRVFITPIGKPPGMLWVENISNTSFDIVTDTAPTADLAIAWQAEI